MREENRKDNRDKKGAYLELWRAINLTLKGLRRAITLSVPSSNLLGLCNRDKVLGAWDGRKTWF